MERPEKSRRLDRALPAAVFVITLLVFLPSLRNGFVNWDDAQNFLQNPFFRGLGPAQLKWMFTTFHLNHYQPLSWLTYGLDYTLWGLNPAGYHLTSVLAHCAAAAVFSRLALALFRAAGPSLPGRSGHAAAAFAALFFSLHPLRVESVTWVTERRDVLCGLFYISALLAYVRSRDSDEPSGALRRHALPLLLFLAALLSKSMVVTLPAALLLLDAYPLRRLEGARARAVLLEKLPYLALSALFACVAYYFSGTQGAALEYRHPDFLPSAAKALFAVPFYVVKTALPVGLVPLYSLPGWFRSPLWQAASALAIAGVTALLVYRRRRGPAALWLFYLAAVFPVSGLINGGAQAAADRYTYIPALPFALMCGGWLRAQAGRRLPPALAGAALLLCALAGLTWRQQGIWRDSGTLWAHAIANSGAPYVAHGNLGSWLSENGRHAEAAAHFREAIRIKPDYAGAYYNLARELAAAGQDAEAEANYREALRLGPVFGIAAYNLGLLLEKHGRRAEAEKSFREALRIDPGFAEACYSLGNLAASSGKLPEAERWFGEAVRLDPAYADAQANLCAVLAAAGRAAEGEESCRKALSLAPGHRNASFNLGLILSARGDRAGAAAQFGAALRADPAFSQARAALEALRVPAPLPAP